MIKQNSLARELSAFARLTLLQHRKPILNTSLEALVLILAANAFRIYFTLPKPSQTTANQELAFSVAFIGFFVCFSLAFTISSNFTSAQQQKMLSTLPVTTSNIVWMPMAIQSGLAVAFWTAFWVLGVLPASTYIPYLLPTLLLILIITASNAFQWLIRSGNGGLGCLFFLAALGTPFLTIFGLLNGVPPLIPTVVTCVFIAASIIYCLKEAPSVRSGSIKEDHKKAEARKLKRESKEKNRKDFPLCDSPQRSLLAYYRIQKRHRIFPYIVGFFCAIGLIRIPFSDLKPDSYIGVGHIIVSPAVFQIWWIFPIAMIFGSIMASALDVQGRVTDGKFQKITGIDPFLAIRPISSTTIVSSRIQIAVQSSFWAVVVLLGTALLWLASPAQEGATTGCVGQLLLSHLTLNGALSVAISFLIAFVLMAGIQITTMAVDQLSSLDINQLPYLMMKNVVGLLPFVVYAGVPSFLGMLVSIDPKIADQVIRIFTLVSFAALAIKAVLLLLAQQNLQKRNLLSQQTFLKVAGIWLVSVLVLTGLIATVSLFKSVPMLTLGLAIAILLPANRILWHIYFLDSRRHSYSSNRSKVSRLLTSRLVR